jgi:excisionase family DNA binding protein
MTKLNYISVQEAAAKLNVSRQHVHQLIQAGRIDAERLGSRYLIPANFTIRPLSTETRGRKKKH